MFVKREDWGECENCKKADRILTVFIHHPTDTDMWVCSECTKVFDQALQQNQVPGLLGEKIQKARNGKGKATG